MEAKQHETSNSENTKKRLATMLTLDISSQPGFVKVSLGFSLRVKVLKKRKDVKDETQKPTV